MHAAEGLVARGHDLGERDEVGLDGVALRAPHPAGPPEPGDDLVGDEQHVVLAAQALDLGPVRRLRWVDAAGPDDRLADERGDLVPALREQRPERLRVVDADVHDLLDELAAVARLVARDPGKGGAPRVHPVVAVLARHDDPLVRPTLHVPVAADELRGGVDRIRAARAEEHDGVVDRRQIWRSARPVGPSARRCTHRTTSWPAGARAGPRPHRRSRAARSRPRSTTGPPWHRGTGARRPTRATRPRRSGTRARRP